MIVNLLTKKSISTLILPEKISGQYWLYWKDNNNEKLIDIAANDDKWVLNSNSKVKIIENEKYINSIVLTPMCIYWIEVDGERYSIFTEPKSNVQCRFVKCQVNGDISLSIGRNENNDIIVNNGFVSGFHAVLEYTDGKWFIHDNNSTNYIFVNGIREKDRSLKCGDLIYIMGFKIIIGGDFIAINDPDGQVIINNINIKKYVLSSDNYDQTDESNYENKFFYRSPRFKRKIESKKFKIDPPPQSPIGEELPMILTLGPSVTMGMFSMITGINAVNNAISTGDITSAISSLTMSVSMLFGTILWPTLSKRFDKKRKTEKEELRQQSYQKYLANMQSDIAEEQHKQETILRESYITYPECIDRIMEEDRKLWERAPGQEDFLQVKVGSGSGKLDAEIVYQEKRFTIEYDNLLDEMYKMCEAPKLLKDIPMTISLVDDYISGIIGDRKKVIELVKGMVLQIITYYSYNEVKLAFIYDEEDDKDFSFVKWLPHVWSPDKKMRYIACTDAEVNELSSYFEKIIDSRMQINNFDSKTAIPYYVIFAVNRKLSVRSDVLKHICSLKNLGISVVTLFDNIESLPKECSIVVELDGMNGKIFDKDNVSGEIVEFDPDIVPTGDLMAISKKLMNIELDERDTAGRLPNMLTFLEMYGVGRIEHLNIMSRWKENDPTLSLEAPIGVDAAGRLFKLDLHEKYHGPHGLVAGMTGSGKSEFIITYILSMAVNYHPDEVAFILIDYKGGGLAGAFFDPDNDIKLPHLAGTITNLDGASINRSLISIQSELRRRQAIFNKAKRTSNEGTMDIYKYQKLYRRGLVKDPVPHLFIISDEFAELKTQQPEFMEQLISAARIGRSLGVHLILATQKPNGVVDDQIWSNSRFRVCLKVQEKADSMDMIKRPDAASIAETGRFYLQVGFNEFFDMGQSAWCGAPYVPSDRYTKKKNDSITVVDNLGRVIAETKITDNIVTGHESRELVELVKYLSALAREEKISALPLWLDPIPDKIYVDELETKYSFNQRPYVIDPILGEYDDPFNQRQDLLSVSLSSDGNTIIYGAAGSGVETAVTTLIYSIIKHHNADEVNIYAIDLGAETLTAFTQAPQMGDVLLITDAEKMVNLFKMVREEVVKRKRLFSDYGGNYFSYIENSGNVVPNIVVIIENFAVFAEAFNSLEDELVSITRDCQKYGIYFLITATSSNAVRYRLQQNFKQMILLQMNDYSDYVSIFGQTEGVVPSKIFGRGIIKIDKVYEFQTALVTHYKDTVKFIKSYCNELAEHSEKRAKRVPVLPKTVNYEFIQSHICNMKSVPIGVIKNDLEIAKMNFDERTMKIVSAEEISDASIFIDALAQIMCKLNDKVYVVNVDEQNSNTGYEYIHDDYEDFIVDIFRQTVERHNTYVDSGADESSLNDFDRIVVIFFGLRALRDRLDADLTDKLDLVFKNAETKYKMRFIVVDNASSIRSYSLLDWYKERISVNEGIWIGEGVYRQNIIKLNRARNTSDDVAFNFGYLIEKGKEKSIKLLDFQSDIMEDADNG